MKRRASRERGPGALDLASEAVHLLRTTPLAVLVGYYIGALPFILGLLYFWADMSRNAFAYRRCFIASLALAGLFVWMKSWQTVFAAALKARLAGTPLPRWTPARVTRMVAVQTALQPWGLVLIPAALTLVMPFFSVYAAFQAITVNGDGTGIRLRDELDRAWRQAMRWPMQNHILTWLFSPWTLGAGMFLIFGTTRLVISYTPELHLLQGMVWFFIAVAMMFHFVLPLCPVGCVVAGNIALALVALPSLLQSLFGIETVFTLSGFHAVFNTTFLVTVYGLSYLCLDPLVKAATVLRAFYGDARRSGEDLTATLRRTAPRTAMLTVLLFLVALPGITPAAVPGDELDASIEEVISRPQYSWRLSREREITAKEPPGWFLAFWQDVAERLDQAMRYVWRLLEKLFDWLKERLQFDPPERPADLDWQTSVQILLFILLATAAALLGVVIYRMIRNRRAVRPALATPLATVSDVLDEDTRADQHPAGEWMRLARELMAQGELRLAMRAMFLAGLAHLADTERITIAQHKSNREYRHELDRKAHDAPDTLAAFADNIRLLEAAWYGQHPVTPDTLNTFTRNQEQIAHVTSH